MSVKEKYLRIESILNSFFHSDYYIVIMALITFIGWVTGVWVFCLFLLLLLTTVMFCVCKNTIPLFTFFWFFLLVVSSNEFELQNFGWLLYFIGLLVVAVFFNIFRFKPDFKGALSAKSIKSSTFSMILLIIPMSLGGLAYGGRNVIAVLIIVLLFIALAFLFIYYMAVSRSSIEDKESVLKYVIKLMFAAGLIIAGEIIVTYMRAGSLANIKDMITGKELNLGWGTPNPVASAVALCIPANFYFMMKKKKFAFVFVLIVVTEYILLITTGSRGALLFTTLAMPVMFIYVLIKTENKIQLYIALALIALTAVVLFAVFSNQIMDTLSAMLNKGLDDSGRFELYEYGWRLFKDYPIFGVGWDFGLGNQHVSYSPFLFHSTVIQVMACSGILGIIVYLYYYWARYSAFFKRRNFETWTLLAGMVIFESYGMIDPILFFPPTFFIQLMIMSFAVEQAMPADRCRPLLFVKQPWKKFLKSKSN